MGHHWKYPNLTLLIISLGLSIWLLLSGKLEVIHQLGSLKYLGIFLAGMLFTSTFTIGPAGVLLFTMAQDFSPWVVAVIGGLGGMCGDYIAYRFIKDQLFAELHPLAKALHIYRFRDVLHTKYFAWLAPVVGAMIIASPLPDELGLTLLGVTKLPVSRFLLLAFCLDTLGIYLLAVAAQLT